MPPSFPLSESNCHYFLSIIPPYPFSLGKLNVYAQEHTHKHSLISSHVEAEILGERLLWSLEETQTLT